MSAQDRGSLVLAAQAAARNLMACACAAEQLHGVPRSQVNAVIDGRDVSAKRGTGFLLREVRRAASACRQHEAALTAEGYSREGIAAMTDDALTVMREEFTPGRPAHEVIPLT